jgi:hypothetical protein
MEKRAIFPAVMFLLSGASFLFGGWQYVQSRSVQAASQKRMAFIVTTIEKSDVTRAKKQELYASIMQGLPPAPGVFSLDFSGSFASVNTGDSCTSEGQRSVCRALKDENTDASTMTAVCGACNPK